MQLLFKSYLNKIILNKINHKRNYILKNVNEKTLFELSGEYDKNMLKIDKIEVKNLKI